MKWDLEDIDAYLGFLEMEVSSDAARQAYHGRDREK
jgi:hypothetical protein